MKQIKYYDIENKMFHGGILFDNGDIICACCGGLISTDEQEDAIKIVDIYKNWIDFSNEIID